MAITYDTRASIGGDGSLTLAMTLGASVNILIVFICQQNGYTDLANVKWNTTESMTQFATVDVGGTVFNRFKAFALLSPTSGSHNVTATGSGYLWTWGISFTGYTLGVIPSITTTGVVTASSQNLSVTTLSDNSRVLGCAISGTNDSTISPSAGYTYAGNINNWEYIFYGTANKSPAGLETVTLTRGSSGLFGAIMLSLEDSSAPAATATTPVPQLLTLGVG